MRLRKKESIALIKTEKDLFASSNINLEVIFLLPLFLFGLKLRTWDADAASVVLFLAKFCFLLRTTVCCCKHGHASLGPTLDQLWSSSLLPLWSLRKLSVCPTGDVAAFGLKIQRDFFFFFLYGRLYLNWWPMALMISPYSMLCRLVKWKVFFTFKAWALFSRFLIEISFTLFPSSCITSGVEVIRQLCVHLQITVWLPVSAFVFRGQKFKTPQLCTSLYACVSLSPRGPYGQWVVRGLQNCSTNVVNVFEGKQKGRREWCWCCQLPSLAVAILQVICRGEWGAREGD